MISQLQELIPMETPLGSGYAIMIESTAHDYYWTVALENGALVTFPQSKIRISRCYTYGRGIKDNEMATIIERKNP